MQSVVRHIVFTLLIAFPLHAGNAGGSPPDTGKVYRLEEILISADRYPVSARAAGAVSYIAPGNAAGPFAGAGEALSAMRNLHLMSYGGGLSLRTLSVRGMGAEHTLLLWNGMPAGNMQTGVADLSLFDPAGIDMIQVVPGGASALYGSPAVCATVNLVPAIPYGEARWVEASAGAGSFGETDLSLGAEAGFDSSLGLSARIGSRRSAGNYVFGAPHAAGEFTRTDGDYLCRSANVAAGWRSSGRGRIGLNVSTLSLAQGTPGPWYDGSGASTARRTDDRVLAGVTVERHPSEAVTLTGAGLFDRQYERFVDAGGLFPADDFYRTVNAGVSGQVRYAASKGLLFQAGTDGSLARAAGNAIDRTRTRRTAAINLSASLGFAPWERLTATITPSGRYEGSSSSAPRFSPKIGVNMELERDGSSLRLHSTAGTGRRNPTMNELYFTGAGGRGNPSLRDESSTSFDAGVEGRAHLWGGTSLDVTWYRIRMTDRILWAPTEDPYTWSPVNVGRSLSTGWEMSGQWTPLPGQIELTADYSIIDSKRGDLTSDGSISYNDQLVYVPVDKGSFGILLALRDISDRLRTMELRLGVVFAGKRYTAEDNSASLPGYRVLDATLSVGFTVPGGTADLVYAPRNLENRDVEILPGYPMPRFHHTASITYRVRY